jgi:hypothetical protein
VPRPELGPTQSPIEFVSGPHSLGAKRQDREADHSPAISAEAKNVRALPPLRLASSSHVAQLIMQDRDSSVGIETVYGLDDRGSIPSRSKKFVSSQQCSYRLCGILSNVNLELLSRGKTAGA